MKVIAILAFWLFQSLWVHSQDLSALEKLRIDPDAAMGGTVSQYIQGFRFITFESAEKSAFGNIDQLEITDQYYLILDRETTSVLIFDKQGKLHARIDGKKISPQHPVFYNFTYDKSTQLIAIDYLLSVFYFDLNGTLVKKQKRRFNQYYGTKTELGSKFTGYYNYSLAQPSSSKDSLAYELMVLENGKLMTTYLPYTINRALAEEQSAQNHTDFYPDGASDSIVYYVRDYDYKVYRLTPHTLQGIYEFIFPLQYSLPPNFTIDSTYNLKRAQYCRTNKEIVYRLSNFFIKGDCIFFKLVNNSFSPLSYVYNTKTQSLVCINKIVSDAFSYYLPVTDAEIGGVDFTNRGILQFDGTNMYTAYSSLTLFAQMEATIKKKPKYPPELVAYFKDKKNYKGNPVLVQIQFKPLP